MAMQQMTRTFNDVEHEGDIDQIVQIIHDNGGKVLHRNFNYEAEWLELTFEVPDKTKFREAVKDEYWFS
jgi:hypothetical protein